MASYGGYELFLTSPNWIAPKSQSYSHPYELMQSLGLGTKYSNYDVTLPFLKGEWLGKTKSETWDIVDFFDSKMGRFLPFWVPSWDTDIVITSSFVAGDSQLTIEDIEYSTFWLPNDLTGRFIIIQWPDESYVCKKIIGAPTSTTIVLDETIGKDADSSMVNNLLTSFLFFVRFDQDELEAKYVTRDVAIMALSFKSVPSNCDLIS